MLNALAFFIYENLIKINYHMVISDCYKAGFVVKPHGLKGEVTISIDPDTPNDFATIESVFLADGENLIPYFITSISITGNKAYVKFEDIDTLNDAEALSKSSIFLPKSVRPPAEKGEFYDDEVMDFQVTDENLGDIGKIADIMTAGPNRLLVVNQGEKEILIPINGPFITQVDRANAKLHVNLPDGFLDI